jgi:hypothetical protein
MLLLVVFAALLAAPAIVMALMTDLGGNIFPTIQSDKADTADPSANPHRNTSPSPATQGEEADIVDPSANTLPAQTIQSDKDDYAPGKTVTLTGSNWQPGESVHINVNDDQGKTWSRNVDVTADASGRIQYQFQLPTSFVATYEVTAMGEQSGVATTSFTEGNVSAAHPPLLRTGPWTTRRMALRTLPTTLLAPREAMTDPGPSPPIPRAQRPRVSPMKSL